MVFSVLFCFVFLLFHLFIFFPVCQLFEHQVSLGRELCADHVKVTMARRLHRPGCLQSEQSIP